MSTQVVLAPGSGLFWNIPCPLYDGHRTFLSSRLRWKIDLSTSITDFNVSTAHWWKIQGFLGSWCPILSVWGRRPLLQFSCWSLRGDALRSTFSSTSLGFDGGHWTSWSFRFTTWYGSKMKATLYYCKNRARLPTLKSWSHSIPETEWELTALGSIHFLSLTGSKR